MTSLPKLLGAVALGAAGLAVAAPAMAEMGISPVGPGGMYLSLFGGYVSADGPETVGHLTVTGLTSGLHPHVTVGAGDGGFVGGSAGYVLGGPALFGLENMRVEAGMAALLFEDDEIAAPPLSWAIQDLDFDTGVVFQSVVSTQTREVYDYSIALKGDAVFDGALASALGIEVFLRQSADETSVTSTSSIYFRTHEVDALFYGAMAVLQPEYAVTEMVSLVADFGAGVYGVNAEAASATNIGAPLTFNDSGGAFGFRGRATGGIRLRALDGLVVTAFGGIDYWSDVPFADQSAVTFGQLPTVAFDDLVELKAGLMLTWALGPPAN
jgi:hypothetical protein